MIHRFITLLSLLTLGATFATEPTTGQWEMKKKAGTGMVSYGITLTDGQIVKLVSGVPTGITLNAAAVGLGSVENIAISTWAGTTNITTLGTVAAGTWQGSVIAPAYLGTGSSITTKFLRGDGTWQTVSSGITIGSTAISGGTSDRLLTSGTSVGELILGTGVSTLLTTFTKANLDAAISDGDVGYLNSANVFTQSNTFNSAVISNGFTGRTVAPTIMGVSGQVGVCIFNHPDSYVGSGAYWAVGGAANLYWNGRLEAVGYRMVDLPGSGVDCTITCESAGVAQIGIDNGAPVTQTIKGPDGDGTNIAGGNFIIAAGRNTGSASPGNILFKTAAAGSSGTTAGTLATRMTVTEAGVVIGASGAAIRQVMIGGADIDFPAVAPNESADENMTVTGAAVGDYVVLRPGVEVTAATDGMFSAIVTSANTVTVRYINNSATFTYDHDEISFSVLIIKP